MYSEVCFKVNNAFAIIGAVKKVLKKDNRLPSRNLEIGCFFGIIDI